MTTSSWTIAGSPILLYVQRPSKDKSGQLHWHDLLFTANVMLYDIMSLTPWGTDISADGQHIICQIWTCTFVVLCYGHVIYGNTCDVSVYIESY